MFYEPYFNTIDKFYVNHKSSAHTSDNTSFSRGWDAVEDLSLEKALQYWGCGRWRAIENARICPGKKTTQICLHTQRLLLQQALKPYTQLHLDFEKVREWNLSRIREGAYEKNGLRFNEGGPKGLKSDREYVSSKCLLSEKDRKKIDVFDIYASRDAFYKRNDKHKNSYLKYCYDMGFFSCVDLPNPNKNIKEFEKKRKELGEILQKHSDMLEESVKKYYESEEYLTFIEQVRKLQKNILTLNYVISLQHGIEEPDDFPMLAIFRPENIDVKSENGKRRRSVLVKNAKDRLKKRRKTEKRQDCVAEFDFNIDDDEVSEFREPVVLRKRAKKQSKEEESKADAYFGDMEDEDDVDDKKKDGDFTL